MDWLKTILEENKDKGTDAINEAVKKVLPDHFVAKADFNAKSEQIKTLQGQITQRDEDLKTLKASAGSKDLQGELNTLQTTYKKSQEDYEKQIADLKWESQVQVALAGKVHDMDYAVSLFDRKKPIEEQLPELQKSKAFAFIQDTQKTSVSGVTPAEGTPPPAGNSKSNDSIGARLGKQQATQSETETPYFK